MSESGTPSITSTAVAAPITLNPLSKSAVLEQVYESLKHTDKEKFRQRLASNLDNINTTLRVLEITSDDVKEFEKKRIAAKDPNFAPKPTLRERFTEALTVRNVATQVFRMVETIAFPAYVVPMAWSALKYAKNSIQTIGKSGEGLARAQARRDKAANEFTQYGTYMGNGATSLVKTIASPVTVVVEPIRYTAASIALRINPNKRTPDYIKYWKDQQKNSGANFADASARVVTLAAVGAVALSGGTMLPVIGGTLAIASAAVTTGVITGSTVAASAVSGGMTGIVAGGSTATKGAIGTAIGSRNAASIGERAAITVAAIAAGYEGAAGVKEKYAAMSRAHEAKKSEELVANITQTILAKAASVQQGTGTTERSQRNTSQTAGHGAAI